MKMKNFVLNKKTMCIALLLSVLMLATFVCGTALQSKYSVYAASFEDEVLNYQLPNCDFDVSYSNQIDDKIQVEFEPYISVNSDGYIMLDDGELDSSDEFIVQAIAFVKSNIESMNRFVEEGVATIDENYELVYDIEDEYSSLWSTWNFKLYWNKFSVDVDKEFAAIISIVGAVAAVYSTRSALNDMKDPKKLVGNLKAAVSAAGLPSSYITFLNDYATTILFICSTVLSIMTLSGISTIITLVIDIIVAIFAPPVLDCLIILVQAIRYNKNVRYQACWIPVWVPFHWVDTFGASVKLI